MSDQHIISVIIPCYNGERFIGRALDSVLGQNYSPLEVIVVDDGSSDGSPDLLQRYRRDDRVQVISHSSNRGIPAARNTGIRAATGRFITFLDQDDYWRSDKLERQVAVFLREQKPDLGLVFSDIAIADDRERIVRKKRGRIPSGFNGFSRVEMLRSLFSSNFIPLVTAMVRREVFDRIGLLNEEITTGGDDYEYCLRLLTVYSAHAIDSSLVTRTMHDENYTNAARMLPDVIIFLEKLSSQVPEVRDLLDARAGGLLCDMGGYYLRSGDSHRARERYAQALHRSGANAKALLGYAGSCGGPAGRAVARVWYAVRNRNTRTGL